MLSVQTTAVPQDELLFTAQHSCRAGLLPESRFDSGFALTVCQTSSLLSLSSVSVQQPAVCARNYEIHSTFTAHFSLVAGSLFFWELATQRCGTTALT